MKQLLVSIIGAVIFIVSTPRNSYAAFPVKPVTNINQVTKTTLTLPALVNDKNNGSHTGQASLAYGIVALALATSAIGNDFGMVGIGMLIAGTLLAIIGIWKGTAGTKTSEKGWAIAGIIISSMVLLSIFADILR